MHRYHVYGVDKNSLFSPSKGEYYSMLLVVFSSNSSKVHLGKEIINKQNKHKCSLLSRQSDSWLEMIIVLNPMGINQIAS